MNKIKTEVIIKAKPEAVWAVLTDFDSFPQWNPFLTSISGDKNVGERLSVTVRTPDGKAMKFKPRVLVFEENKELRWMGKLLFQGLFAGEHYFLLQEMENGATSFVQGENFSGLLVGQLANALEKTEAGFNQMNAALKRKCEAPPSGDR